MTSGDYVMIKKSSDRDESFHIVEKKDEYYEKIPVFPVHPKTEKYINRL